MITLQWTGPNNGNIILAPNTSRIVNKNTILDFSMFLSNLKVLKCNMQNLEQKVEKYKYQKSNFPTLPGWEYFVFTEIFCWHGHFSYLLDSRRADIC